MSEFSALRKSGEERFGATAGDWALGDFWGSLATETRVWIDHVITGRPCVLATPAEARLDLETTIAIARASRTGETVRLPLSRSG